MAQSLKTKYLLLALGVGARSFAAAWGFAYYEHRIDSADITQLTYATVEQKLEGDLEARANSVGKITGTLLAPALCRTATTAAIASIAGRLLEERDIERVEVTRCARRDRCSAARNRAPTGGRTTPSRFGRRRCSR